MTKQLKNLQNKLATNDVIFNKHADFRKTATFITISQRMSGKAIF